VACINAELKEHVMTVILVVATILFFVGLDWAVRRSKAPKPVRVTPVREPALPVRMPEGIFFARNHTWMNLFPSGKIRLGIDDFVGRLLDHPTLEFLKQDGETVSRGEPILALKQNGHNLTVRSPLSGTILSRNSELPERPEMMKEMLFSDGWAYTIQPAKTTELRNTLFGVESREWIKHEFARLRDILAGLKLPPDTAPVLLQDGGLPVAGFMRDASDELWRAIEQEFLTTTKRG